jgi:hypothetical protein
MINKSDIYYQSWIKLEIAKYRLELSNIRLKLLLNDNLSKEEKSFLSGKILDLMMFGKGI